VENQNKSTLRQIKYQLFKFNVASANQAVSLQSATTDRNYDKVKGIAATVTDGASQSLGTFTKFEINRREMYPLGFEVKMLTTGQYVAINDRFDERVDEEAANSVIDVTYQDNNAPGAVFPYTVTIYALLENPLT